MVDELADVVKKDVEFGELNSQDKDMRYTIHSTLKKVTADLSENSDLILLYQLLWN